jgi:hypothetical protein
VFIHQELKPMRQLKLRQRIGMLQSIGAAQYRSISGGDAYRNE